MACLKPLTSGEIVDSEVGPLRGAEGVQQRIGGDNSREKSTLESYRIALERDPTLWSTIKDEFCELRERTSLASCFLKAAVPGHAAVYDAVVWQQGRSVICATGDGNVYVLGLGSGTGTELDHRLENEQTTHVRMVLEGHLDMVTTLALSSDGKQLLTGSLDKTLRVWDLSAVEAGVNGYGADMVKRGSQDNRSDGNSKPGHISPVKTLEGHTSRINCLRWTPCGAMAISSSTDSTLRLWDTKSGVCLHEMRGHGSLVSSIDLSIDGKVCASASGDAVCKLWGIPCGPGSGNSEDGGTPTRGELIADIAWESGPVVLCQFVAFEQHGEYLVTAHAQLVQQQARILLWDVFDKETGWVDGRLRAPCYAIDDLRGCPTCIDTTRVQGGDFAGTELLACACSDGKVHVWDISECPIKLATYSLEEPGHSIPEDVPAWSVSHLRHASNKLNMVSFSPSGTYLAATRSQSSSIVVWEVDEGEEACQFYGHKKPIRKLIWVSDYKLVSISEDGTVRGWSVPDPVRAVDPRI